jgi:hypothetical protein
LRAARGDGLRVRAARRGDGVRDRCCSGQRTSISGQDAYAQRTRAIFENE